MSLFTKEFHVSNPSPNDRNDYVEVDLSYLEIPDDLEEFQLFRVWDKQEKQEIPYQLDHVHGKTGKRMLTFFSKRTPFAGDYNYKGKSATFLLQEGTLDSSLFSSDAPLWIGHYYKEPIQGKEPEDGFNREWYPDREVDTVKLASDTMEIDFKLSSSPTGTDYSGSVTSVSLHDAQSIGCKEMLAPFNYHSPNRWWGQIYELVFFPVTLRTEMVQTDSSLTEKIRLSVFASWKYESCCYG